MKQYLDLVRDAGAAFGLPPLPANVVRTHNITTGRAYEAEDRRHNRNGVKGTKYDKDEQQDRRDKAKAATQAKKEEAKKREEAGLKKKVVMAGSTTLQGIGAVSTAIDAADGAVMAELEADGVAGADVEEHGEFEASPAIAADEETIGMDE
ncbi:hypothetical protein LTR78_006971 [Recurvomyces mirabilis]|uniref:Uncharacterized protein n=1 Tax=Recurvomyces mirabilis TaxID=574656 RepID=A0AAE1BZ53_9PEZI|nr:hypothetical protein LTR78_006971 [Recurvomyces mirabilis]KAK5153355.1 hypothetical protein LTS14_007524 [Recurvomyces mirabilis]